MADVIVQRTPFPHDGPWNWVCRWGWGEPDVWHSTVDDQGFAFTEDEAKALADEHVRLWHSGEVELCDKRLRGRLSMRCTAPSGHDGDCIHTTKYLRMFRPLAGEGGDSDGD